MEEIEKRAMMTMGHLPESCMSRMLCFTTPRDVCRLSAVNRTFRSAINSDSVWEKMLPIQYPYLLARLDSPLEICSKKELYFALCHPNWIDGRTKLPRKLPRHLYVALKDQIRIGEDDDLMEKIKDKRGLCV